PRVERYGGEVEQVDRDERPVAQLAVEVERPQEIRGRLGFLARRRGDDPHVHERGRRAPFVSGPAAQGQRLSDGCHRALVVPPPAPSPASALSSHARASLQQPCTYQKWPSAPARLSPASPSPSPVLHSSAARRLSCSASSRASQVSWSGARSRGSASSASRRKK